MATPTTLPAAFVSGDILTAAQMNNLRGAFRILQVVQGTTSTGATTASVTWVDTTLTATITPSSTSSLILIMTSSLAYTDAASTQGSLKIIRNNTTDIVINTGYCYGTSGGVTNSVTLGKIDNPNSTSPQTYKMQMQRFAGTGNFNQQMNGSTGVITLMEISA